MRAAAYSNNLHGSCEDHGSAVGLPRLGPTGPGTGINPSNDQILPLDCPDNYARLFAHSLVVSTSVRNSVDYLLTLWLYLPP